MFTYYVNVTDYATLTSPSPLGSGTIAFTARLFGPIGEDSVGVNYFDLSPSPTVPGDPSKGLVLTSGGSNYIAESFGGSPPDDQTQGVIGTIFTASSIPASGPGALIAMGGGLGLIRRRRAR